jgi:hypothetical protein
MKLAITLLTFLAAMAFTTTASADADDPCTGTVCGLGGQIRGQIGDGLPLPISLAPGYTGPWNPGVTPVNGAITLKNNIIKSVPPYAGGFPFVGKGLGQQGNIKPTPNATIMQTVASPHSDANPRALSLVPNAFGYGPESEAAITPNMEGSIGVVNFNANVFAVQTNLIFDSPHPGTDGLGNGVNVPGGGGTVVYSAGGRPGLPTVSYYAGAAGTSGTNWGNATANGAPIGAILPAAGNGAGVNGVARFKATKNQFGGVATGRTLGTAKVYFNNIANAGEGLNPTTELPCTGTAMCAFGLSFVNPATTGVAGGPFGGTANNNAFMTPTGVFTGTIGFNGTIHNVGNPVTTVNGTATPGATAGGMNIPFTGQGAISVGFPVTTGRLSISVTDVTKPSESGMWQRTGTDVRNANGSGVVALVTGSMSARPISKGNANRTWTTLEVPEPSAIAAASAGLLALFGCHQLVRRRNR